MNHDEAKALLANCRELIDDIDARMVELLNERTTIVRRIGEVKQQAAMQIYEPKREEQVYANIFASNAGPLPDDALRRIFERIIDEMRRVQQLRMEQRQGERG